MPLLDIGFERGNQRNEGFGPGNCGGIPTTRISPYPSIDVGIYRRFLVLLDDAVAPELSGVLHLADIRSRRRFLDMSFGAHGWRLTTCTQPQAGTPSPSTLKQTAHSRPSLERLSLSLASITASMAFPCAWSRGASAEGVGGFAWVEASSRKASWAWHSGPKRADCESAEIWPCATHVFSYQAPHFSGLREKVLEGAVDDFVLVRLGRGGGRVGGRGGSRGGG